MFATQVVVGNGVAVAGTGSYASLAGVSLSFSITATGMMQVRPSASLSFLATIPLSLFYPVSSV